MISYVATRAGAKPIPAHTAAASPSAQASTKTVVHLFSGLSNDDITDIMTLAVVHRFAARQTVVRADDPGRHLFMLKTGSVDYFRETPGGHEILIIRLSPGDTFGLGTLLPKPIGYIGTAEALRETELYVWEQRSICKFAKTHSKLAENALRIALEYIRLYSDRHLALVTDSAEHRLSRMLTLLGNRIGRHSPKGIEIQIKNEHLASLADISSYTASRLLNHWERKGAIEKSRGKVVILCPERMLA